MGLALTAPATARPQREKGGGVSLVVGGRPLGLGEHHYYLAIAGGGPSTDQTLTRMNGHSPDWRTA